MAEKIKQSINKAQIVGTLAEMNLQEETKEVILKNGDKEKKVTCKTIGKKDFKNPSLIIEVEPKDEDGNVIHTSMIGVNFYQTHEKKLDENGNVIDNPKFKSMKTILTNYVPKSEDKNNATRVMASCSLTANEYATSEDKKNYSFVSFPQLNCFNITSSGVSDEDSCDGEISGIIRTIKQETITKDEETTNTGRLIVDFYTFDYNGATYPAQLIVEKDLADDFSDIYENGNSCKLYYEVKSRMVGGTKKTTKKAFGRDAHIQNGYTITEYVIFSGDDPYEEECEYFITKEIMKTAMESRQNLIDSKIEEKKKKDKEGDNSSKKGGLGNRKPNIDETQGEDLPF